MPARPPLTAARLVTAAATLALATAALDAQALLRRTAVVTGLDRPVWIGAPPGDLGRLFVIEKGRARVRVVDAGGLRSQPFLDLGSSAVAPGGEQGLLGMAFHPRYAQTGRCFVNYTRAADGATVVAEYRVSATDPNAADPASAQTLLVIPQPRINHNGGDLHFGPDGHLYVAVGDGGDAGGCQAQQLGNLLGKILRLDVDGGTPYAIPADNPFVGQPAARGEIWHYGLRHPWRFSFDRETGDAYIADVGQSAREEISFCAAGTGGGVNFGWGTMEGTTCYSACVGPPCQSPQLRLPIHEYVNSALSGGAGCAVIGGAVYRGCAIPALRGRYVFGDFCSGRIWSLRTDGTQALDLQEHTADLSPPGTPGVSWLTTFGQDAAGELYFATHTGEVWRIEPETAAPVVDLGFGEVGSNGLAPRYEVCGSLQAGTQAFTRLSQALPSSPAVLLFGWQSNPLQLPIGTVVTHPVAAALGFLTSPQGEVNAQLNISTGGFSLYGQWLVLDPQASGSVTVSNALQINLP